jgi:signal transduction histidine kinase
MLWIYARCGLIGIADSELQRWWQHPDATIQYALLDRFDGVVPGPSTFQPAVAKSSDGRLWFVNDTDLQEFDPGRMHRDRTPPPVYIKEFQADRKTYATGQLVHLPARSRDIEIGYTALNFPIPERSNFRYKLEGRDQDWNDAGARRQAFYSDLPPGQYRFRVTASNNDGVWNETGASIDFSLAPAYYQTTWFRLALVAAALLLIATVHQWRLRQVAWQFNTRQEERINERTRIARDLHDTLLQTFQGVVLRFQAASLLLPDRPGDARQTLDTALDEAGQAITEARDAVQGLRGTATATALLPALVSQMGEDFAASHQRPRVPAFRVQVEGTLRLVVPAVRDEVARIVREALRNAFKHADARAVEVEIRYDRKQLRVRVRDDGRGISADVVKGGGRAGHYGLAGMRERAELLKGTLAVWSQLAAGTEIELTIPGKIAYTSHPPERVASA